MMWVMLTMVFVATLAVHLGLPEAITKVATKISKCERCCSFWCTAAALWYCGADLITIVSLSIIASYLSHWVALLLHLLQNLYSRLWQKVNK